MMDTSVKQNSLSRILWGEKVPVSELEPGERVQLVKQFIKDVKPHLVYCGRSFFPASEWVKHWYNADSSTMNWSDEYITSGIPIYDENVMNLDTRVAHIHSMGHHVGGAFVEGCGYSVVGEDYLLVTQKGELIKYHFLHERGWDASRRPKPTKVLEAEFSAVDDSTLEAVLVEDDAVVIILHYLQQMLSVSMRDRKRWLEDMEKATATLGRYRERIR